MKVGVIGTGHMGANHVRTYLSMGDVCQLVGVYDGDETTTSQIAEQYHVKAFPSLDELLRSVDAVSIAVPTAYHYDIGMACIRRNVPMLMEKPLTLTVEEADDLIQTARKHDVTLQTGHIELFNPFIQILMDLLEDESIISMHCYRASPDDPRLKDVNVVKDLMIHDIYLFFEWLKETSPELEAFGVLSGITPRHASATIETREGKTAQLTASFLSSRQVRSMQFLTENAFIKADILSQSIHITRTWFENTTSYPIPVSQTMHIGQTSQPLYLQLMDFLKCLKTGEEPYVTGEDGKKTLVLANKITNDIINAKQRVSNE